MATELALHAYIFLGNALKLLVDGAGASQLRELHGTAEELARLYGKLEPLTPANILESVGELPAEDRRLLLRVCLWCVERLGQDLESAAGITAQEATGVIGWLEQDVGGA